MGYVYTRDTGGLENSEISGFFGINRSESSSAAEFFDMLNMSSEKYPYLSPRKPRVLSEAYNKLYLADGTEASEISDIRAAIAPCIEKGHTGFCGVVGTKFYYNGHEKTMKKPAVYENDKYKYGMEIPADGKIQLIWANRTLIIHGYDCIGRDPFVYYYDVNDYGTSDDYVKSYEYKKESYYNPVTMELTDTGYGKIDFTYKYFGTFPGEYFDFKVGDSVFIDGFMEYRDSRWSKPKKYVATSAIVKEYSEAYSTRLSGYDHWNIKLTLQLFDAEGNNPMRSSGSCSVYHIYKKIPYMTHMALHKGRLWGANPNGEYVYASALNDLFNFNVFDGLNDDSVFLESSTQGGYMGVYSCKDVLVTFKRNEMEAIYGELPSEFAVGKTFADCGCIDMESCVQIDGVMYFLGSRGFFAWSGARPQLISERLETKFKKAFAFTDGLRYFASAEDIEGKIRNLVYTPRYGIWNIEDNVKICGAFRDDTDLYIAAEDKIYKCGSQSGSVEWSTESVKLFGADFELNRVSCVWLDIKFEKGASLKFYSAADGGEWRLCGIAEYDGAREYKTYRIPVRLGEGFFWRYKLEGKGGCVIYRMRIDGDNGGRIYENKRRIVTG